MEKNTLDLNELLRQLREAREALDRADTLGADQVLSQIIEKIEAAIPTYEYLVRWEIDVVASSPREACEKVWRENFNRTAPWPGDACMFDVVSSAGPGAWERVDLGDDKEDK